MIDLHTHTFFSDGELLASELIRRAEVTGYRAIALTDHADISNLDLIIPRIRAACEMINARHGIIALPGIELTHVHPLDIGSLAAKARSLGACIIVVHGETIAEPVRPGTNKAALAADIDILAHPGLLSDEDAQLAARRGIYIEISARKGHSLTNGHVAQKGLKFGVQLIVNTDAHSPDDLITREKAQLVARGAGLAGEEYVDMLAASGRLVEKARGRKNG